MKLSGQKGTGYNKYSQFIDKKMRLENKKTTSEIIQEAIFGKSKAEQMAEYKLDRAFEQKARQHKFKKGRLGQSADGDNVDDHITSILQTIDGTIWTGEVYFARKSRLDLVFDTGSDWLVVEGVDCDECEQNKYDPSTSAYSRQISTKSSQRFYGSAVLTGTEWEDQICILLNKCINNFQYFLISSQRGIFEPVDGILGMARNKEHIFDIDLGDYGPLIVNAMYDQDMIQTRKFSFFFVRQQEERVSFVDFGAPQPQNMKNPNQIEYIKVLDDFFWSAYNQGIAIGNLDDENTYSYQGLADYPDYVVDNSLYTILDTGSTAINFSSLYFEDFIDKIFAYMGGLSYKVQDGLVKTKCYTNFPDLWFMFSNKWIKVDAKDYVFDITDSQDGSSCILLILPSNTPMHVIGMPLLVDYYTVHDMDQGTIGFVPHSISSKTNLVSDAQPTQILVSSAATSSFGDLKSVYNVWTQLICAAILAVAIVIFRFLLYGLIEGMSGWFWGSYWT